MSSSRLEKRKIFLWSLTNIVKDPDAEGQKTHIKSRKKQKPIEKSKTPKREKNLENYENRNKIQKTQNIENTLKFRNQEQN